MRSSVATIAFMMAFGLAASASVAQEQDYPDRPVTLIVPFTTGGGTDILARLVGERLEEILGQPLVIENRPGGAGAVGAEYTARQEPDGYTLMVGSGTTHGTAPVISAEEMSGILTSFSPVAVMAEVAQVIAVHDESPITNLSEYLDAASDSPLNYGTFGVGSGPHLLGEMLAAQTGAQLVHVPYPGSGPAVADLTGNHIDSVFLTVPAVSSAIEAGQLRAIVVTGERRLEAFSEVETFQENGLDGFQGSWFGIFAPLDTPLPIREKIADAVIEAVNDPELATRLVELGYTPMGTSPEEHGQIWDDTVRLVREILEMTDIDLE